jgi:hypothetical protein
MGGLNPAGMIGNSLISGMISGKGAGNQPKTPYLGPQPQPNPMGGGGQGFQLQTPQQVQQPMTGFNSQSPYGPSQNNPFSSQVRGKQGAPYNPTGAGRG